MNILQEKSTVIVIFAGLMVFHHNQALNYFKVGILKDAPDHVFEIYKPDTTTLFTTGAAKTTARRQSTSAWPNEMVLEVINNENGTRSTEATSVQEGAEPIPRMDSRHNPEDWRYAISFDELYPTDGHSIRDGSLGPNIYIRGGELYTLCRTDFLRSKKGLLGTKKDFGFVAELMGLRVELQRDQSLVLSGTALKVDYDPTGKEQYVVIANVPTLDHRCSHTKGSHCKDFDTHFQHYYLAIPKDKILNQYDFGHKNPHPSRCRDLPEKIAKYLEIAGLEPMTPPPYFCGIASTSKEWSISEEPSLTKTRPLKKRNKKH